MFSGVLGMFRLSMSRRARLESSKPPLARREVGGWVFPRSSPCLQRSSIGCPGPLDDLHHPYDSMIFRRLQGLTRGLLACRGLKGRATRGAGWDVAEFPFREPSIVPR